MSKTMTLIGALAALAAFPAFSAPSDPSPEQFVNQFRIDAQKARTAWLEKKSAAETTAKFLKTVKPLENSVNPKAADYYKRVNAQLKKEKEEEKEAEEKALRLSQKAYEADELVTLFSDPKNIEQTKEAKARPLAEPKEPRSCSLDTEEQLKQFDADCLKTAENISQGNTSLFGRVVEKQGATAQVVAGKEGQKAILRFADTALYRSRGGADRSQPINYQRKWTLGYSLAVQTTNITNDNGRLAGLAERSRSRSLTDLDRLDEKVSVAAGISFNKFPKVLPERLLYSAWPAISAAKVACELDNVTEEKCTGEQFIDWINSNPEHLAAISSVYWGSEQKIAKWGFGLQAEVARPVFTYFPFEFIEVPDPLNPGKTKTVIDLSQLPASFPNEPVREAKVPVAATAYMFRHFPIDTSWNKGVTLIGSATWKRQYEINEARRDVIICPTSPGLPVETNELCRKVNAAAPESSTDYLLAGEIRTKFGKFWLFDAVGFAPKFTHELRRGRRSLDLPFYVTAEKKDADLSAGVRVKWDSGGEDLFGEERKDELLLSIFFGTTFDFDMTP